MTPSTPTPLSFARLFELGDHQVLFEILPSKSQDKRQAGIPDVMISTHLGWSFYEARVELRFNQDNVDTHEYLLSTFTQEKAEEQLGKIQEQFGAQAIIDRMLESGEYSLDDEDDVAEMRELQASQGEMFAKLLEVDGRQVVAVAKTDLGASEEEEGLVIKVAQPGGAVMEARVEGQTLDDFTAESAQHYVALATQQENRKSIKP